MFRPIEGLAARRMVTLRVEGRAVVVPEGQALALALLQAGVESFRETPVSAAPRGPMCLMGVCFDCLVQVDGRPNVQACMVHVRDGMQVQLQRGARRADPTA